ncbi:MULTISPECIES: hypothetical protein [Chryseobacterium]|uniref:Uncharacterized protein n=1 Tax=Chryseobacterium taihuense TaxID=1141221 RepID=A0A4U8WD33_9FLAO|nr:MULTISPECIES: hypothetical protein [Chryseobacterium]QQV03208.1 hypothetical protein I6I61_02275 [Chryseobacterium sp. FDAARGOS 1104]VFB03486.1 Uncharacterised protein [Chryseobacterium taihuense]
MKILRFTFALPLGIFLSFLSFYLVNILTNVANLINTSNYPIPSYLSTFISGAVLISTVTYIAPAKRKMFLFIALFIGIIIFISNIVFIKDIQFAFIVGIVASFISVYRDIRNEVKIIEYELNFINSKQIEEINRNEEYISKISQLNIFEQKNETMNDDKNINFSERAKRAINKSKKKLS